MSDLTHASAMAIRTLRGPHTYQQSLVKHLERAVACLVSNKKMLYKEHLDWLNDNDDRLSFGWMEAERMVADGPRWALPTCPHCMVLILEALSKRSLR